LSWTATATDAAFIEVVIEAGLRAAGLVKRVVYYTADHSSLRDV